MIFRDWSFLDIEKTKARLAAPGGKITFGIDGYIDEVWQVIEKRTGDGYKLYSGMKDFGQVIIDCGSGGVSNEIIRKRRSYGGFTANTGKAAGRLGAETSLVGMFGKNSVDPVFHEFAREYNLVSVGDSGISQIYEFEDGKIMLPYINEIIGFGWDDLKAELGEDGLLETFGTPEIIAMGYWSLMPAFNEIVGNICENYLRKGKPQRMFFDFADIRKREKDLLMKTLGLLSELNKKIPMSLSLNEHEAEILFSYYNIDFEQNMETVHANIAFLREKTGLDEVIVHTPHFASAASESVASVVQHYCERPLITTGAGDNFNGGYLKAMLAGLEMPERLAAANAATGLYVRNGCSPDLNELINELREKK